MKEKVYKNGNIFQKIFYTPGFLGCIAGAYLERYLVSFVASVGVLVYLLVK